MLRQSAMCAIALLAISQRAIADDDSGFYLGIGAGEARNEQGDFRLDETFFKAFAGYAINRYLAGEVTYIDPEEGTDTVDSVRVAVDSKGVIASIIASAPLTDYWSVFGKLGWAFYDVDQTTQNNALRVFENESDDDFVWGVGTTLKIAQRWRLRLDYEVVEVPEGTFRSAALSGVLQF